MIMVRANIIIRVTLNSNILNQFIFATRDGWTHHFPQIFSFYSKIIGNKTPHCTVDVPNSTNSIKIGNYEMLNAAASSTLLYFTFKLIAYTVRRASRDSLLLL